MRTKMESGIYKESPKAEVINAVPQMLLRREVKIVLKYLIVFPNKTFWFYRLACLDTINFWVVTDAKCTTTSCPTLLISYKTITTRRSVVLILRKDTIFSVLAKVGFEKSWIYYLIAHSSICRSATSALRHKQGQIQTPENHWSSRCWLEYFGHCFQSWRTLCCLL